MVLGLLARHGPQHGYQLRRLIELQNIDRFANVQLGSIYGTLKRLTTEALVEARATEDAAGRGPARAIHAITEAGREQLEALLAHSMVVVEQPERPVDLALHLSSLLPIETVVELLEQRLAALTRYQQAVGELVAATDHPAPGVQELVRDIGEHFAAINAAELEWTERVLRCARTGGYRIAGGETS